MLGSSLLVRCPGRAGLCCHEGQPDAGATSGTEVRVVWCSFDEILEMSARGDNSAVDMLVGDIYGGMDYSKVTPPRAGPPRISPPGHCEQKRQMLFEDIDASRSSF